MKIKLTLILLTFSLLAFSQDYPKKTIDGKEYYVYTVQAGDGLMAIGRKFDVSQAEITAANPNINENIKVGQKLYIPVKNSSQPPVKQQDNSKEVVEHKVEAQQTFFAICKIYGVSQEEVLALNKGLEPAQIKIGQIIKIPVVKNQQAPEKTATVAVTEKKAEEKPQTQSQPKVEQKVEQKTTPKRNFTAYEVKKNKESLYSISKETGVSINEILEANPEAENGIKKGDILQIPVKEKEEKQQPAPKNEQQESRPSHTTTHSVRPSSSRVAQAIRFPREYCRTKSASID